MGSGSGSSTHSCQPSGTGPHAGSGTPRGSGGPSSRGGAGQLGGGIEDECHKKAALSGAENTPEERSSATMYKERIIATNYGIGSENEPREWWVLALFTAFSMVLETSRIN